MEYATLDYLDVSLLSTITFKDSIDPRVFVLLSCNCLNCLEHADIIEVLSTSAIFSSLNAIDAFFIDSLIATLILSEFIGILINQSPSSNDEITACPLYIRSTIDLTTLEESLLVRPR